MATVAKYSTVLFVRILIFSAFFEMLSNECIAQQIFLLKVVPVVSSDSQEGEKFAKKINYKKEFISKTDREKELDKYLFTMHDNAFLAASFDSVQEDTTDMIVYFHAGERFEWIALKRGNVEEGILSDAGFRDRFFRNKPLYYKKVRKLEESILEACENNGYPFASIRLDSITFKRSKLSAILNLNKGARQTLDSMTIKGSAKIAPVYMYNYLSIKRGMPYNEAIIKQIPNRIRELPFVTEVRPFDIAFTEKKSYLYLYLDNKKASQFDFVAGFLPDSKNPSKLILTGDAHLKLQNSLGRGEVFELNWRSPQPLTQDLKLALVYPFVFSTPFGLDLNLWLYKKDTTYLDVERDIGVQYILTGGNYFKIFYKNKTTTLLSTKQYENATSLPPFADIVLNTYGLGYKSEKLDYRYNPRKGWSVNASTSVGTRTIEKNQRINDAAYKNVDLSTTQYQSTLLADFYIPLSERSLLNLGTRSARIQAPTLLKNELFRIGGLKTLRGFDEESIRASTYIIIKIEPRYIIEQNSYMFAFFNWAYYEENSVAERLSDRPYGFGAGVTFETKLGLFSFNYALGKQFNNPIYLRSGKIHFGVINYF